MSISEKLTQQKLQEILLEICRKSDENMNRSAQDIIEEIKKQILLSTK
ncbi:hypothetical protein [Fictibacillus fluitans]|uniref:Uncharacterized protein n=1 Tax=Fictibacillus fluitans TaxID=3058422 RepID=A0ABT8I176_9BACL|nr:hypothetical protein [Fictibacillus sp. NE201]MDN4526729.1 hypothetical protein [Fictibacillus sp. NE201]